jgi:hypothetical protein
VIELRRKMNKRIWLQFLTSFLAIAILSGCSTLAQDIPSPSATAIPTNYPNPPTATSEATVIPTDISIPPKPTQQPVEITFEEIFVSHGTN